MLIELQHNRISLTILDPKTNNTSAIVGVAVGVSILIILIIAVVIFVRYKKKYRWYPRMSLGFSNAMYRREIDESYWLEMLPFLIYYCFLDFMLYFYLNLILHDIFVNLCIETMKVGFFNVDYNFMYDSAWLVLLLQILKLTRLLWCHDSVAIASYLFYALSFVSAINLYLLFNEVKCW